jgi:hypothetical protein
MSWNDFTERYTSGNRVSPAVTLTTQNVIAESSSISWNALTPTGTTLTIEIALSADGGTTWGAWRTCTSGQAISGLSELSSLANVQLQIRETLTTNNVHATPELLDLTINITTAWPNIAYGPNKSTLTAWDSVSLAWKSDRLSLVVNDSEACYIENPGLPTAFGSYVYIGTDRNGANSINTLVDELRIDKVYREVNTRTGWHKAGTPFYTSEDMKQLPGYLRAETDGYKVYDSSNALRVLIGSWMRDMIRKYGIKIIGGELYSSFFQTGEEGENRGIIKIDREFLPDYPSIGWGNITFNDQHGNLQMKMTTEGNQPQIYFYDNGTPIGEIRVRTLLDTAELFIRNEKGIELRSEIGGSIVMGPTGNHTSHTGLLIRAGTGKNVTIDSADTTFMYGNLYCTGDVEAFGDIIGASKRAVHPTKNYGIRVFTAVEAPEVLFYDRGRRQLENGECTVYLDPIFLETIEPDSDDTPWDIDVNVRGSVDVDVIEVGGDYFKVKERNGVSNNSFTWRLEAVRKGYKGIRMPEGVL